MINIIKNYNYIHNNLSINIISNILRLRLFCNDISIHLLFIIIN